MYRFIEGRPYTGDYEIKPVENVQYSFVPLESFDIDETIDYSFVEGDKQGLKACIGYDVLNNDPVVVDMTESHLLVAGASRWGKSNVLNVLITSLMLAYTPNEVRFILCDYKNADLKQFERYKHIAGSVATDKAQLMEHFNYIKREMEKRAKILNKAECLNAINYNKVNDKKMTYIIFVIDELAQVTFDKAMREELHFIMCKAASYGIYFILASQDCTKDTIGRCKINVSHTIGLHVRDKADSDMVIKNGNLEDIKVKGRAKYDCGGLVEFQSFYISETQIKELLKPLDKRKG